MTARPDRRKTQPARRGAKTNFHHFRDTTAADEEGTHARLKAHREELLDPTIAKYQGHVIKNTGDGLLAEFPSAVDCVACAVEIQRRMARRNQDVVPDRRMELRIGINVGTL